MKLKISWTLNIPDEEDFDKVKSFLGNPQVASHIFYPLKEHLQLKNNLLVQSYLAEEVKDSNAGNPSES